MNAKVVGVILLLVSAGWAGSASAQSLPFMQPVDKLDLTPRQAAALAFLRKLPTTQDVQIVKVDPKALAVDDQVIVRFKSQAPSLIRSASKDVRGEKLASFSGEAQEQIAGTTTMVVDGNNVTASIHAADGLYRISPLGGGLHAYVKVDTAKMPPEHPPSFKEKEQNLKDAPPVVLKPNTSGTPTTISVLVAYTPAVAAKVADINLFVQLAFAETNQSYKNSGIAINLIPAPANPMLVNYKETGSMDSEVTAFAAMADVRKARAANHSNLAVLLLDDESYCGQASKIYAEKETAFAIVYYDCATGYYSFGHEIGHLQGARHNPEEDPDKTPFAYGHGFMDPVRKRRTIMSYDCPDHCDRMPEWARPTDWGDQNVSNDARVLNETAAHIASFK